MLLTTGSPTRASRQVPPSPGRGWTALIRGAAQIESYVFDVVRSSVPKIDLDDVFTTKEEIASNIKKELEDSMGSFGYEILATPITDIDPDAQAHAFALPSA